MIPKNKYNIEISDELLIEYYQSLIKGIYKLLPLFEGLDLETKNIIYSKEEAYQHFQKYRQNFIYELCGGFYIFDNTSEFLKLLNTIEGMQEIQIDEHDKLKSLVFNCINICKKIIKKLEVSNNAL